MSSYPETHQRNTSQGQQLILHRSESTDEERAGEVTANLASPSHPMNSLVAQGNPSAETIPSACCDPDYGQFSKDFKLRDNPKVVIGSVLLTIFGAALLVIGIIGIFRPKPKDPEASGFSGWVFLFAGVLVFVPGIYHVVYIVCTLCGCPGYSLNNLPTFNR